MTDQPALPGMPDPPAPRRTAPPPAGVRISQYRPRTRVLCDVCVQLIHQFGQAGAPLPRAARWRCTEAGTATVLCTYHKENPT